MSDRLDRAVRMVKEFAAERDWGQFHDPKNLAMCLASEAGELLAELRWIPNHAADRACQDPAVREKVGRELGDIGIAWLLMCDRTGMDPFELIERKLQLNALKYPPESSRGQAEAPKTP